MEYAAAPVQCASAPVAYAAAPAYETYVAASELLQIEDCIRRARLEVVGAAGSGLSPPGSDDEASTGLVDEDANLVADGGRSEGDGSLKEVVETKSGEFGDDRALYAAAPVQYASAPVTYAAAPAFVS